MAKITICKVLWFVLEYTVVSVMGETVTLTLCEQSHSEDKRVKCPKDELISLKKIAYGGSRCQDTSYSNDCLSYINKYFNDYCIGKNNCTLSTETLSNINSSCKVPPRRLQVYFKCAVLFFSGKHSLHTCTNSVAEVKCHWGSHIHIESVRDESGCTSYGTSSVETHLITTCDNKRKCLTMPLTRFFQDRFVSVSYVCKESTDSPVTDSTQSTSADNELDMTTISTAYVTDESDMLPMFSFDNDSRIEINHHTLNNTVYMCSYGWDDHDADVLCKTLNKSWTGHAKDEDKLLDLDTAPYSLHCSGLETSLFECNYTIDQQGCNLTKVAGAICCQGTGRPGECVTNISSLISSLTSDSTTIGVALGIPLTLIAVIGFIIAIIFIRRRYIHTNSEKQTSNSMRQNADDNYIGQQGISLPQFPSNNRILYNQATNSTHTQGIEGRKEYSNPSKDAQSLYALSEDGVYDKANEKRHVVNDTAVYSRAVDTMYDSTDQQNRKERKEGTYDHVFGQKTEDHYDITTRP